MTETPAEPLKVARADPLAPEMTALLAEHHELMTALFEPEANHFLDAEALAGRDVVFFGAWRGARAVGCGALALRDGYGEIKSMYVVQPERGGGAGSKLLAAIEAEAGTRGLPLLRLETGDLLAEARSLYESHGFKRRGPFGDYADHKRSVFMEKRLAPGD